MTFSIQMYLRNSPFCHTVFLRGHEMVILCHNFTFYNLNIMLSPVSGGLNSLKHLHTLSLAHNQLITTRGLGDCPSIQRLCVSHNHLPSLTDLERLGLLQEMEACSNNLMQIPLFSNHVLLSRLSLSDNSISSMAQLAQSWLPLLHSLDLAKNR